MTVIAQVSHSQKACKRGSHEPGKGTLEHRVPGGDQAGGRGRAFPVLRAGCLGSDHPRRVKSACPAALSCSAMWEGEPARSLVPTGTG